MEFEPDILSINCNWCGYAGADSAGAMKLEYPTSIRIARVMCMGRVDPLLVLHAFEKGYDGVMMIGCHIGDCHYISGNIQAEKEVEKLKKLLHIIGIGSDRLLLNPVSAGEGPVYARVANEFYKKIQELGPNPLKAKAKA